MKKACFLCAVLIFTFLAGGFSSVFAEVKIYTNSIGMDFALIPAGSFMMGCDPEKEKNCFDDEKPQHKVAITQSFYIGKYEVTQAQWDAVMGDASVFKNWFGDGDKPVSSVSWNKVQEFIRRLNQKEGTNKYRLPTEAEWEYAARAGSTGPYYWGDNEGRLDDHAWYGENSKNKAQSVGKKEPNAWGLYDVYGNVWEWVQDWYTKYYYAYSPESDPKGPDSGDGRVLRGGGWHSIALNCRSAGRYSIAPNIRYDYIGFRLAFSADQ